jgi:hypothetical protein
MNAPTLGARRLADAVLRLYRESGGLAPTLKQIGDALGVTSTATVLHHLGGALEAGLVRRGPSGSARSVLPITPGRCPLCGTSVPPRGFTPEQEVTDLSGYARLPIPGIPPL